MEKTTHPFAFLTALVLALLLGISTAYAVGDTPTQKVWVTPADAAPGTPIVISAFLYNDQKETVTYTLEVKAADTKITTTVVTLSPGSAKTLTFDWKEPEGQTTIAVSVVSALGKNKKDIPILHGTLGAASVGEKSAPSLAVSDAGLSIVTKATSFFESFRSAQAERFTTLRDEKRASLGVGEQGQPPVPTDTEGITVKRVDNPADYAVLILATTLTSFFAHATLFYAISILIAFLLVRFLVRMFI